MCIFNKYDFYHIIIWILFQGAGAKRLDENGNPSVTSSSGSVSFAARQLKPLSIYRHNPAFHSQHVSVNQMDEIPSLSPTSLQPTTQIPSTSCSKDSESKNQSSKSRRKKKVLYVPSSLKLNFTSFSPLSSRHGAK